MTVQDVGHAVETTTIPRPREPRPYDVPTADAAPVTPAPAVGEFPWPEPWHFSRGTRPRSEFWDVETAGWRSRGPVAAPRTGD
jgi:hypothetical protein